MKKLDSTLKNMVIVLTGTAILTGGVLAIANSVTKTAIANVQEKQLATGIQSVIGIDSLTIASPKIVKQVFDGKEYEFVIHSALNAAGTEVATAVETTTQGFGGDLNVLVGFDNNGRITGYTILKHSETPGLGAKADTWFQKGEKGNVIGKYAGNLVTNKDEAINDSLKVNAITASTITSRAFLKAVNQAYLAYKTPKVYKIR